MPWSPGAPDEMEQQGLGVVVGGVGGGDAVAAQALCRLAKEGVPHVPGGLLQPPALPGGLSGHAAAAYRQLTAGRVCSPSRPAMRWGPHHLATKSRTEGLVPVGLRPPEGQWL